MEGYVKIHRKLLNHPLWSDKPFSKGQAWVDLIMLANYKERSFVHGATVENVERGGLITSEVKLSERWGWSRQKVRTFIAMLVTESMIEQKKDTKKTYLKISQYCIWQDDNTQERHQKDIKKTSKRHQKDTNNKGKNINKGEEGKEINKEEVLAKKIWLQTENSFSAAALDMWIKLCGMPKWLKKPDTALELSLKKLLQYQEDFSVQLMEDAISGNYQGVVFSDTDKKYQDWLRSKNTNSNGSNKQVPTGNIIPNGYKSPGKF